MFCNKKSLVIVTGASRGLGRSISLSFGDVVGSSSAFVLMSRSVDALAESKQTLLDANPEKNLKVLVKPVDNESATKDVYDKCFEDVVSDDFDALVLVHNAGSLGPQGKSVKESFDLSEMQTYFAGNLFSVMALNGAFFDLAKKQKEKCSKIIINISSLCADEPFSTWSFYCMGKSARDMMFKVLALEEKNDEHLKIINYAPGPLDTVMVQELIDSEETDVNIRNAFVEMKSNGKLLTPDQSSAKLIKILKIDNFKNGDHVDYFDVE